MIRGEAKPGRGWLGGAARVALVVLVSALLVWLEAAGVALWARSKFTQVRAGGWLLSSDDPSARSQQPWPRPPPCDWPAGAEWRFEYRTWCTTLATAKGWGDEWRGIGSRVDPPYDVAVAWFGYPLRTFRVEVWEESPRGVPRVEHGGVRAGWSPPAFLGGPGPNGWTKGRVPLVPIWGNFAVMTLGHAAVIGAVVWGVPRTLRRRREARGVCVRCTYDRRGVAAGSPCPECGAGAAIDESA